MNVGNISSATATVASSSVQLVASVQQEAMETTTQTKTEALKGDQQAIRRMAKINLQNAQAQPQPVATPAPTPTSGQVINVKA